jgi:hypothetical protein
MWRCQGQQDVGFDSTSSSCDESRGRSGFHRRRLTQRAEQRQRICLRVPVKYFFKVSLHGQDPEVRISEGDWQTLAQVRDGACVHRRLRLQPGYLTRRRSTKRDQLKRVWLPFRHWPIPWRALGASRDSFLSRLLSYLSPGQHAPRVWWCMFLREPSWGDLHCIDVKVSTEHKADTVGHRILSFPES